MSLYEAIILLVCIGLYVGSFLYGFLRPFIQERRLRRSEIAAELDMLANKLCEKKRVEEGQR